MKMKMCICLFTSLIVPLAAVAIPPDRISYQGVLRDPDGAPLGGTFDMVFRFFSAAEGGSEIIVDDHSGADAVTVTDGLFDTHLGGGSVSDGSGPSVFVSMASVFQTYGTVFLQVEIEGEVLEPRIEMVSAPYALQAGDAELLDGANGSQYLRKDVSDQFTGDLLTIHNASVLNVDGELRADGVVNVNTGSIFMNDNGPDQDQVLWFYDDGSSGNEWLFWNESEDRFNFSDDLHVSGTLQVGGPLTDVQPVYSRFGTGEPESAGMNNAGDVLVSDDLEVLSTLLVSGDMRIHSGGPDGDQIIYFYENGDQFGEYFFWDDSADRFEISDTLRVLAGELQIDNGAFEGVLRFSNTTDDTLGEIQSSSGVSIRLDTDNDESGPNAGVFVISANGDPGTPLLRLQSTNEANLELDNGVITDAFDFAEAFKALPHEIDIGPGEVVSLSLDNLEYCHRSTTGYDDQLLGIVSTNPAFVCGMSFEAMDRADPALAQQRDEALARGDKALAKQLDLMLEQKMKEIWKPVAMVGRVPTKVDGQYGAIKAGDRLTSSPTPGHAMKMTRSGQSVGVAMEDFNAAGTGTIMVFVRPGWVQIGDAEASEAQQKIAALEARLAKMEALLNQAAK